MSRGLSGRWGWIAGALVLGAGCGSGELTVVTPPAPPSGEVSLLLPPLEEDAGVAAALGWSGGIAGAVVVLVPVDSSAPARTVVADSGGRVVLEIPAGVYEVSASRWLSAAERALVPVGEGVVGWAARVVVRVGPGAGLLVRMAASRRRSLVVSKWFFGDRVDPILNESYPWANYIRVYNNADSTVYVDGILIARALDPWWDFPNFPCALFAGLQDDPLGVWVIRSQRFPGTGREHPLLPGQDVLVALDAIDHGAIVVDGPDLRGADYEFIGPADVDNPAVPNMVDTGPSETTFHGPMFAENSGEVVLSLPVDVQSLPTVPLPPNGDRDLARIPLDKILDVVTYRGFRPQFPPCARAVTPLADRSENTALLAFTDDQIKYLFLLERRRVPIAVGGQVLLQHTRDSESDLVAAPRDPRLP